jgi:hypothetical protein
LQFVKLNVCDRAPQTRLLCLSSYLLNTQKSVLLFIDKSNSPFSPQIGHYELQANERHPWSVGRLNGKGLGITS